MNLRIRSHLIGGLILAHSGCAFASRPPGWDAGISLLRKVEGPWTATLTAIPVSGTSPPVIDDLECQVSTAGLTLVVSSKGRTRVDFVARGVVEGRSDLNSFNVKSVIIDRREYLARLIMPNETPSSFLNMLYKDRLKSVQMAEGYVSLTSSAGVELPANAYLSMLFAASSIKLVFADYKDRRYSFNLDMARVPGLLGWCRSEIKSPKGLIDPQSLSGE